MRNGPEKPRTAAVALLLFAVGMPALGQEEIVAAPQIEDPREILSQHPPFEASERVSTLEDKGYYPCSDCHDNEFQISDPTVRVLEEMHDEIKLVHGQGRFWCLTCHHDEDRDQLSSLKGQPISFDESFLLCGQCHFQRQQDFFYGAHGKRIGGWQGERVLAACPECHDPHDPRISAEKPYPPPTVRTGLERPPGAHHPPPKVWEKADEEHGDEPDEGGH